MKHLKSLLLATALFIGATTLSNAQEKVAHISLAEIITAMPEYKAAQAEVEQAGKTYEAEIQDMVKTLDAKLKQYDAEANGQTADENQKRMQEVEGMKQSISQYQQQAQQGLQKQETDKMKPIREKAQAAVKKVATALGIDYVLDISTLVVSNGKDITPNVKKELGI
jgi:outer membrane protein